MYIISLKLDIELCASKHTVCLWYPRVPRRDAVLTAWCQQGVRAPSPGKAASLGLWDSEAGPKGGMYYIPPRRWLIPKIQRKTGVGENVEASDCRPSCGSAQGPRELAGAGVRMPWRGTASTWVSLRYSRLPSPSTVTDGKDTAVLVCSPRFQGFPSTVTWSCHAHTRDLASDIILNDYDLSIKINLWLSFKINCY